MDRHDARPDPDRTFHFDADLDPYPDPDPPPSFKAVGKPEFFLLKIFEIF
jgi:hypothetical protein